MNTGTTIPFMETGYDNLKAWPGNEIKSNKKALSVTVSLTKCRILQMATFNVFIAN